MLRTVLTVIAVLFVALTPAQSEAFEDDASVARSVREILTDRCLSCHASDVKKGGLDLSRQTTVLSGGKNGPAVVPGKPETSVLIERLEAGEMPPKRPLSPDQVALFRTWIAAGANYPEEPLTPRRGGPDFWSLQPIQRPAVPAVGANDRLRNPIDAFIVSKLEDTKIEPAPEADRPTLIRRLSFDLTGLPPRPEEVRVC